MNRFPLWIETGFKAWQRNWTALLGVTAAYIAVLAVAYCLCCMPYFLIMGPITCGYYAVLLQVLRGGPAGFGPLGRIKEVLLPALLTGMVVTVLGSLPTLLSAAIVLPPVMEAWHAHAGEGLLPTLQAVLPAYAQASSGCLMAIITYGGMVWSAWVGTRLMFALPLVADRGVSVGEALAGSWALTKGRFWLSLLLVLVIGIIISAGCLLCCVGLLVSAPLGMLMLLAAYEDLTRAPVPPGEPPLPADGAVPPAPPL